MITQDSLVLPRRRCRWRESRRCRWRKGSGTAGLLSGQEAATGGRGIPRRGDQRSTGRTMASPRASGTPAPSCRAMFFNSRTVIQSPSMIAPVQTPITPAMISVLPVLSSGPQFRMPIASRPAKTRPIAATNITNIIELTPQPRPKRSQAAPRHDTVILCAPPTANCVQGSAIASFGCRIPVADDHAAIQVSFSPPPVVLPPTNYCPFVALHQGFRPQFPITWKWNCAIWVPGE